MNVIANKLDCRTAQNATMEMAHSNVELAGVMKVVSGNTASAAQSRSAMRIWMLSAGRRTALRSAATTATVSVANVCVRRGTIPMKCILANTVTVTISTVTDLMGRSVEVMEFANAEYASVSPTILEVHVIARRISPRVWRQMANYATGEAYVNVEGVNVQILNSKDKPVRCVRPVLVSARSTRNASNVEPSKKERSKQYVAVSASISTIQWWIAAISYLSQDRPMRSHTAKRRTPMTAGSTLPTLSMQTLRFMYMW